MLTGGCPAPLLLNILLMGASFVIALVLFNEEFCVLDKEVHIELILWLLEFVWIQIEENFVVFCHSLVLLVHDIV